MTREKIEILVVCPKLDIGGAERHLLQVLPRLDRARFSVTLAVLQSGGGLEVDFADAGLRPLSPPSFLPKLLQRLWSMAALVWILAVRRPDIVHFFLPEAYILGGIAAWLAGTKRRILSRRNLNWYQKDHPLAAALEKRLHRTLDAAMGNSRAVTGQLREEGVREERIGLLYNGIDVALYGNGESRAATREALGLGADALVLIVTATLIGYKGHRDLLQALAVIAGRLDGDWVVLCVGRDAGAGKALGEDVEALGLSQHVRFLGARDDVAALLSASDIGVLASHEEGFSNSLLEYMAAGLAVVATDVGGTPEVVDHEETGLLVPAHDPDALSLALLDLAKDPAKRARLGRAGRHRVETRHALEACVAGYERLYGGVHEKGKDFRWETDA